MTGHDLPQAAQRPSGRGELHARLLGGFADRGPPEIRVLGVPASARERDVSGPGIPLRLGALDQKNFELGRCPQDQRNGCLRVTVT